MPLQQFFFHCPSFANLQIAEGKHFFSAFFLYPLPSSPLTLISHTSYYLQTLGSARQTYTSSKHQTSKQVNVFSTRQHGHNPKCEK